ncbi:MAG: cysteine--tRNA ligase [Actinomycetes bacterium]
MLNLHDTATGQVRRLELRDPGKVSMYVCGPTVYDLPHLGHGRFTLVFDVLRRYLIASGLEVTYVSNITDIDDNIINKAVREGRTEAEVAAEFEARWWEAMDALDVLRPDEIPHATAFVDSMVATISELIADGVAYGTPDGVYLETAKVPGYGLLAGQPLESLRTGARIEADESKRSPLDFALWKAAKPGEPTWPAPFGAGRPGWHTECVVMSLALLGDGFDLHGGGLDLKFPHHENERAQAIALGRPFAQHWAHNGWVMVGGEKMSKSLGNFTSLTDLLAKSDGRAYRMLVLRSHYRVPIEVTTETIADAERGLARLDGLARRLNLSAPTEPVVLSGRTDLDDQSLQRFTELMDDDLQTPQALGLVFELIGEANTALDGGDAARAQELGATVVALAGAMGLRVADGGAEIDEATLALAAQRDEARAAKDFARSDALRDELQAAGWVVEDTPEGTALRR